MGLASSADNIRFKGTGRAYYGAVGGSSYDDTGELEGLSFGVSQPTEKINSTRNASKAVILEAASELVPSLTYGMREWTNENLKNALLASGINTDNQAASYVFQDEIGAAADVDLVNDLYIDLGRLDLKITKLSGVITGSLEVDDNVTQSLSGATGKIAFVGSNYIELVNVVGTFVAGQQVYETLDTNHIVPTGIEVMADVIITNAAGTERRTQGIDYTLDVDYGLIRKLSTGAIIDTDLLSYDYPAVNRKYMWGGSAGIITRKIIVVTDKNDLGPRTRWTFHKVSFVLNGDFPIIGGDGASILQVTSTVLWDATQPSGQEYYKTEIIG